MGAMGERDARERFARAVDDGATQSDDEELAAELAVVSALRQTADTPVSDEWTRHNVAARVAHKIAHAGAEEDAERAGPTRRSARRHRLRPVLAAAFCLLMGLGGLAIVLSQSALPGDALYPVKRARETATLALTFDGREQAMQRLAYAADRVDELRLLAEREGSPSARAAAYAAGLVDFDNATRAASVTLTGMAAGTGGNQLQKLRSWTARQSRELTKLAPALPTAAAERQAGSVALLERVEHRADTLRERFDCYRITSGSVDELGAVPATGECLPPAQRFREQRTTPSAPVPPPPPATTPAPQEQEATSPPAPRPDVSSIPEHRTVSRLVRLPPSGSTEPEPLRFEPVPATPAPPPAHRPRVPSGTEDAAPPVGGAVRDLVDRVLDDPLGG